MLICIYILEIHVFYRLCDNKILCYILVIKKVFQRTYLQCYEIFVVYFVSKVVCTSIVIKKSISKNLFAML